MEKPLCPHKKCRKTYPPHVVKDGFFARNEDARRVQRFRCRQCKRFFSASTTKDTYRQRKRRINNPAWHMFNAKVSERRMALWLKVNRRTVVARRRFWAKRGRRHLKQLDLRDLIHVQFDEMQSSIHSKCKPVAIPLAVDFQSYRILALDVASMPAQHPLKETALRKYGPRADNRPKAIARVLKRIQPRLAKNGLITTDCALHYPAPIAKYLPDTNHMTVKSRRACVVGQGELKRIGFDPLFPFNHTAAMIRDNVSRLVRRTWATSKRIDALREHLYIYAHYHNTVVIPRRESEAKRKAMKLVATN